ncbi:hypothetical protein [Arthrobacter sp. ES3-54]|uniref:hypothetical protein n=1 Tax=Arthrobacter sp. ES3-54 TaxID=1502991 RepID=UPI002406554B|nr:hypothetical protein [Arthrobacter sp. ES3-54]MDF9751578.1 hypothetical protein [Arthrobacter sp. ES3-54]
MMLGRTGAKSAFIANYLRTPCTYWAAGVILTSAVITPETRQLLAPSVPIISVAISDKSGSPTVMPGWHEKGGRSRHPVSPSASFYAPAVVLSPQGAGP